MLKHIMLAVIAVLSLLLAALILMHKGRGGGFSDFAESLTCDAGGSGVAERNLNRWTVAVGLLWGVLIVAYGILARLG